MSTATGSSAQPPAPWPIAWTLGITELISWGVLYYAFSALLVPMQQDLGWSAGVLTGAYSLSVLVSGLLAPIVGRWIDAHGGRWLMAGGSALGALLVAAWSHTHTVSGYYAIFVGMGIAMACTLYDPAFVVVASWFREHRSRAMLIITFLGGLASTVFLPLTGWLEVRFGWREALLVLAACLAIGTIVPHAAMIRTPPEQHRIVPRSRTRLARSTLLQSPWFRRFALAFFLQSFVSYGVAVHLIAYLIDVGINPTTAAFAAGLVGAAQTGARVVITLFERALQVETMTAAMFGLQTLAIIILVAWPTGMAILLAVLLMGFGRGALTLLRPTMLLQNYWLEEFGAVNGSVSSIVTFATASAPFLTGVAVGATHGYHGVLLVYAGISLLSAGVLLSVRAAPTPRGVHAP